MVLHPLQDLNCLPVVAGDEVEGPGEGKLLGGLEGSSGLRLLCVGPDGGLVIPAVEELADFVQSISHNMNGRLRIIVAIILSEKIISFSTATFCTNSAPKMHSPARPVGK
jgi:hypothetical protein